MKEKSRAFLVAASNVGAGWEEIIILLMPVFEALLQKLIERCTNTEAEAIEMFTNPTPLQARLMHQEVVREMRRDGRVPIRERNARAWQVVYDSVEAANADTGLVTAVFQEVKTPAA